jgi:MFS family permease
MLTSDVIRALLHGTLALLIVTGVVQIWHMIIIGVLFASAQAFFQPAYTGLVPQTVPEDGIQDAQALSGVSRELAAFVSPAVATGLVFTVGGGAAFAVDAATFAISALTLARVRTRLRGETPVRSTMLAELREGWTAVRERPWVWGTISAYSVSLLLAMAPFFVLGPSVSRHVYGTEAVFGFTNAAWGVGTVLGAALGSRWRPRRPMLAAMVIGFSWPALIALFAAGPPVWLLFPVTTASGLGLGVFGVWWETALAQRIPGHLLSRVSAWDWMGSLALLPIGYLLAGPIAGVFGEVPVLIGGGLLGLVAMSLGFVPRSTRTLARLDDQPIGERTLPETVTGIHL